jgi:hypothetical protein
MSEQLILLLSILVSLLGLLTIVAVVVFALIRNEGADYRGLLVRYLDKVTEHYGSGDAKQFLLPALPYVASAHDEGLSRRNEIWSLLLQVSLSMIVIVVITVLLLAKVITPDAGLPILSGVGGFAIGKGVQVSRTAAPGRTPEPSPQRS